jgi:hypothetical protein
METVYFNLKLLILFSYYDFCNTFVSHPYLRHFLYSELELEPEPELEPELESRTGSRYQFQF